MINHHARDILEQESDQKVVEKLKEIEHISNAIIEEY